MQTVQQTIIAQLKRRIEDTKTSPFQSAFSRGYLMAMEHALQLVEIEINYAAEEVK